MKGRDHLKNYELVTLRGGTRSIRSILHGETMHIGTDPRTESNELHIQQQRIVERVGEWEHELPFVIWDVGLGPASNAVMAIESLRYCKSPVEIHSFEISTEVLEFALNHVDDLGYLKGWEDCIACLLAEGSAYPLPHIRWQLHRGDFSRELHLAPPPQSIFHDPYSPSRNPEMWNLETFRSEWEPVSVPDALPCLLTNYTRSTAVRVTLALAGWFIGTGVPTGDKTETTIASNRMDMLEKPFNREWLLRVNSSTSATPLRGRNYERKPISSQDFAKLSGLPQFQ